jgi:hypothetical protein
VAHGLNSPAEDLRADLKQNRARPLPLDGVDRRDSISNPSPKWG